MTGKIENEPAFPCGGQTFAPHCGMMLRDYMAIHTEQPGMIEVCEAAGLVYKNHQVWSDSDTTLGSFNDWWSGLESDLRYELNATVRYRVADAMLAKRLEPQRETKA